MKIAKGVNPKAAKKIIDSNILTPNETLYWAEKRHFLEVIPEFLTSLFWVGYLLVALWASWAIFPAGFVPRLLIGLLFGLLIGYSIIWPFSLELWRWNRDIIYLTNRAFGHYRFDFREARFINDRTELGLLTKTRAAWHWGFKLLGFDVGYIYVMDVSGVQTGQLTPLTHRPFSLQRYLQLAKSDEDADSFGWTE